MAGCSNCGNKIAPGELHSCGSPSLHAPWLQELLEAQSEQAKANAEELKRIRQLLERARENPEAKTRAARRETR